jgi:hypothetical protein
VLQGHEIFLFTDNSTAESAFWKGTSGSEKLFKLALRLKHLELDYDMILHVIHVSGKRMIAQGTDGLSRADSSGGVMSGSPMEDFVPLHLGPLQREPKLRKWLEEITTGLNAHFLTPNKWYTTGAERVTFIWTPPPAAADVVVEQLGRARLKRPEGMHLVVVPRVMTGRWRRPLTRGSECYLRMNWPEVWNLETHFEPLLIFVCIPYRSDNPKLGEQKKLVDDFHGAMLSSRLSETSEEYRQDLLQKFLLKARSLCSL